MKHIAFLLLLLGACGASAGDTGQASSRVEEKFSAGGIVRLHLSPGGYTIRAGDPNAIRVSYQGSSADQIKNVKVKIRTSAASADVFVSDTPHNNFRATIELPARSDLRVRLFAGEVVVEEIEGDKDIEVDAGRIEVRIPNPDAYGRRDASVRAGSIEGSAFSVSKGGLFRSWEQKGPGKYRLHAHVTTGEISLNRAP